MRDRQTGYSQDAGVVEEDTRQAVLADSPVAGWGGALLQFSTASALGTDMRHSRPVRMLRARIGAVGNHATWQAASPAADPWIRTWRERAGHTDTRCGI